MCRTEQPDYAKVRRPGLAKAAKKLGVSYQHLWRVMVSGERKSPGLMARAVKLGLKIPSAEAPAANGKYPNSPKRRPAPPVGYSAAENIDPRFAAILDKIGFERIIVRFRADRDSTIWLYPNIGEDLGAELEAGHLGDFDSSWYDPGTWWHFFHIAKVAKLGAAMKRLKDSLEKRELLPFSTIMVGEGADQLRIYYPPHLAETQVVPVPASEDSEP